MRPINKQKGHLIFLNGERPDAFYLILKGKVDILVPKPPEQIQLEKTLRIDHINTINSPLSPRKPKLQKIVHSFSPFLNIKRKIELQNVSPKRSPLLRFKTMTSDNESLTPSLKSSELKGNTNDFYDEKIFKFYVTRTLEEGMGFGEIPFNNDRPRTYATLCSEDAVLGVIDRKEYIQIFREIQKIKIQEKVDFFNRCFFLRVFEKESYLIFTYSFLFKKLKLKKSIQIYEKDDDNTDVFLIKKGEIELFERLEDIDLKLALLGKGQIFGEEAAEQDKKRRFSAICHSQEVTLFSLNRSLLWQIFQENPEFKAIFLQFWKKKEAFRERKLEALKAMSLTQNSPRDSDIYAQKFYSIRATEDDIDRFIKTPVQTEPTLVTQTTPTDLSAAEIKVQVKAFEDRKKKGCFFRGKRTYRKKVKSDEMNTNEDVYEIDNTEKKFKDRGDETNYIKEIIRNNQKCYNFLDKRSVKFTREEIMQIFDKEKMEIEENRKRLRMKYGEKARESPRETSISGKCQYSTLYDEALESVMKKKKNKVRCQSAMNFFRKNEKTLNKFNEKGEIKVNFHIKKPPNDLKARTLSGRPVSGGYQIRKFSSGEIGRKEVEKEKSKGVYCKIQEILMIQGRKSCLSYRNSDLRKIEREINNFKAG